MRAIPEGEYDHDFIMGNPIPARCVKCRRHFIDGETITVWDYSKCLAKEIVCRDAIRAPQLENCRCFWCGGNLRPLDPESYRRRQKELPKHFIPGSGEIYQPPLFE